MGFDSLQIRHEVCSAEHAREACGIELVSCDPACLARRTRREHSACVPGLPLRTGWNHSIDCHCNSSAHDMINCAGATPHVSGASHLLEGLLRRKPTDTRFLRLPDCECKWCPAANRSRFWGGNR